MVFGSACVRSSVCTALVGGAVLAAALAAPAQARPSLAREPAALVASGIAPGTIVISQSQRRLFLTQDNGTVISYPIAVGKLGKAWSGWAKVNGKHVAPAWAPPAVVKRDNPRLPDVIAGGAPNNPMGAAALTLDREEIAIHGTTASMRNSIGSAASYGCIRMYNEDVIDLFQRVSVGTPVVAIR
jgi:lipoprotein-anchoring transpeptidase ErfK/SrfK